MLRAMRSAICGRVTRSGDEGGKSTRRREYVSTPVISLWRGATRRKVPRLGGVICLGTGRVCGLDGPKWKKVGEYAGMI